MRGRCWEYAKDEDGGGGGDGDIWCVLFAGRGNPEMPQADTDIC